MGTLIIMLFLPVVGVLVAMTAYASIGSGSVTLGVVDQDQSLIAKDLVKSLEQDGQFKILPLQEQEIETRLAGGKADAALIIPQGFAERMINGGSASGSIARLVSIKGETATGWVQNYTNMYLQNLHDLSLAAGGNKKIFTELYQKYKDNKLTLVVNQV